MISENHKISIDLQFCISIFVGILKNKNSDLSSHQTSGTERIYIHEFQTKYFTTSIGLYPLSENNLESLSSKIKEKVEGFLIYFDSSDVSCRVKSIHVYPMMPTP